MKTIRTFSNLAEAGFASSLLESAGIRASLADEQSFLAIPGMASGGIRLQIEEQDVEKAERVLAAGPDADFPAAEIPPVSSDAGQEGGRIPLRLFVALGAAFVLLAIAIHQFGEKRRTGTQQVPDETFDRDLNQDGRPDCFFIYRSGVLSKVQRDRNADGEIDEWEFYDRNGELERFEKDDDFDGRPDFWCSFKNGLIETSRSDSDFDGRPDWFGTFAKGVIVRMDCRPNESTVVLRRQFYEHGVRHEEWVDENSDGTFDYKVLYDPFGTGSAHIPLQFAK